MTCEICERLGTTAKICPLVNYHLHCKFPNLYTYCVSNGRVMKL